VYDATKCKSDQVIVNDENSLQLPALATYQAHVLGSSCAQHDCEVVKAAAEGASQPDGAPASAFKSGRGSNTAHCTHSDDAATPPHRLHFVQRRLLRPPNVAHSDPGPGKIRVLQTSMDNELSSSIDVLAQIVDNRFRDEPMKLNLLQVFVTLRPLLVTHAHSRLWRKALECRDKQVILE
jgi:hypothetical protein